MPPEPYFAVRQEVWTCQLSTTVTNPATEQVIAEFEAADERTTEAAIERSVIAQKEWVRLSLSARRETRALTIGDPLDETQLGPLVSSSHPKHVTSFLTPELDAVVCGDTPAGPGYWMAPRVVLRPDPNSTLVQDEVFGPIAATCRSTTRTTPSPSPTPRCTT